LYRKIPSVIVFKGAAEGAGLEILQHFTGDFLIVWPGGCSAAIITPVEITIKM